MNESPSPVAPSARPKKGLPAIAWVGIGCGTLLVIGVIVLVLLVSWCKRNVGDLSEFRDNPEKAAAEMMVRLTPDLEKVSQDDAKGEMTVRTKTGEEVTLSYKDIAAGKFRVKDANGNVTEIGGADLASVPQWVPRIPNATATTGVVHTTEGNTTTGQYHVASNESPDALEAALKAAAAKLNLKQSTRTSFTENKTETRMLVYEGTTRKLNVVLNATPGQPTNATVGYEDTSP